MQNNIPDLQNFKVNPNCYYSHHPAHYKRGESQIIYSLVNNKFKQIELYTCLNNS